MTAQDKAQSREIQVENLKRYARNLRDTAAKIRRVTPRLIDPRERDANEADAVKFDTLARELEDKAARVETNAIEEHAHGK